MDNLIESISNLGFPIVLSIFLLVRIEGKLDQLTNSINSLSNNISKIKEK